MPRDQQFIYALQPAGIKYRVMLIPSLRIFRSDLLRDDAHFICQQLNTVGQVCPERTALQVWAFVTGTPLAELP